MNEVDATVGAGTPSTPPPPALVTVPCPSCGAKLRNAFAERGAPIRCMNCGLRFVPGSEAATAIAAGNLPSATSDSTEPLAKKIREPRPAGYWLLRIPTILYAAGISFTCVFLSVMFAWDVLRRGPRWSDFMGAIYLPLMPLSGYLFFIIPHSMAGAEAGTIKTMWKRRLLLDSLPPVPGSSLPYIGPLSIGAACLVFTSAIGAFSDVMDSRIMQGAFVPTFMFSMGAFLVAFMFEDLRQFFWRQQVLAETAAKHTHASLGPAPSPGWRGMSVYPALMSVLFACAVMTMAIGTSLRWNKHRNVDNMAPKGQPIQLEDWYTMYDASAELLLTAVGVLGILGLAWTLFLLGSKCAHAIRSWRHAAGGSSSRGFSGINIQTDVMMMRAAMILFAIFGSMWAIYIFFNEFLRFRRTEYFETFGFLLFCMSALVLCGFLNNIMGEVREWRIAQERFWQNQRLTAPPTLSGFQRAIFIGALLLAGFQAFAFIIMILYELNRFGRMDFDMFSLMSLGTFSIHYPIVWVTLLARDFVLVNRMTTALSAAAMKAGELTSEPAPLISSPIAAPHYPEHTHTAAPETPASP